MIRNYWTREVKKENDFIIIAGEEFEISIRPDNIEDISFGHCGYGTMDIEIRCKDSKKFNFTCENGKDAHEVCRAIRDLL